MTTSKWVGSRRNGAAATSATLLGALLVGASAQAAGPAVRALNGRVGAGYVYSDFEDDGSFFGAGSVVGSEDHQGFLTGTLTVPLGESLGLRLNLLPNYGHREADSFLELDADFGGIDSGVGLFWRDPERFELGVEARYSWQEIEFDSGADEQSVHSFEGRWYGAWFLSPDALWPIDLNAHFSYAGIDLDEQLGDEVQESWSVGGAVRLYPLDVLAFSVGGLYRELDSHAIIDTETAGAVFTVDALVHRKPAVTLGPRFEVGERKVSSFGPHFSQTYYTVGVQVTMSFPGGDSLVELNRAYY